ncbi:MAG: response regulator transcription factor [Chloroflexi bacterium]|nr:response regulator transcription factor [Chloroflexota bacterium]
MPATTVFLVDDHPSVLWGLRAALEQAPHARVIGAAQSLDRARPQIRQLQPDVIVVDFKLQENSGVQLIQQLRDDGVSSAVIFLSAYNHPGYMQQAYRSGALGYILKDDSLDVIVRAVQWAHQGIPFWSEEQLERIREWEEEVIAIWRTLTPREQDVLRLLAEGKRNQEISESLNISARTVEYHVTNLMNKLGLHSRTEIMAWMRKLESVDLLNPER